jgi:hypothetical protein
MRRIISTLCATALAMTAVLASAAPASADGTGCAWSHGIGGSTCLGVNGESLYVWSGRVSHGDGSGGANICGYKGRVSGTFLSGSVYSKTSGLVSGCSPVSAYVDISVENYFKDGTYFKGTFYHAGAWAPGTAQVMIRS